MSKLNQDFDIWQGEDAVLTVPVTDSAGSPKTLTGSTVTWKAWASIVNTTASITKTTADDIALVNADDTDDAIQITLPKAATSGLTPGKYYHECRVVDANTKAQVVFEGTMTLHRSKTL